MQAQFIFPIFLTLISMLVTGGPKDLLGYMSSESYWKCSMSQRHRSSSRNLLRSRRQSIFQN